jgi:SAM-dependent methyltransferase
MLHEWLVIHRNTEADYWWFVNKRGIARRLLDGHAAGKGVLLEVGCGGGLFSSELASEGWRVISADLAPAAAAFARAQGVSAALAFDAGRGWPLADGAVDVCIMLDVLEHVQHDTAGLAEARRVLKPGGVAIVSVPAHPFLFSSWDRYNAHYRRYTVRSLRETASGAGLRVERLSYWNAISLPAALVMRLKDRCRGDVQAFEAFPRVPGALNAVLKFYGRAEAAWLKRLDVPWGLSLVAVLRRADEGE